MSAAIEQPGRPIVLSSTRPARFTLGQAWRETPEPELRQSHVELTWRDRALEVVAELVDDDVFNTATAHNQRTWELGDVFEIFAGRADVEGYTEVHVTPDNLRLHLQLADAGHAARVRDLAEVAMDPAAIASTAARTPAGWRVTARVPLTAGPGDLVRVSFCRYDWTRGRAEPVLSSSSPHPVPSFHRPWEWAVCRLGPARQGD